MVCAMTESSKEVAGASGSADPRAEYAQRLEDRERRAHALDKRSSMVSNLRLLAFLLGVGLLAAAFFTELSYLACLPALAVFVVLVLVHDRVIRRQEEARASVEFYRMGLARLDGEWRGKGIARDDFVPEDHLYARDLDLFGKGSLFELMCTARTGAGEETLAGWLLEGAGREEILARQEAVKELRERLGFREDISLLGGTTRSLLRPDSLKKWAGAARILSGSQRARLRVLASVLGLAAVAGVVLTATTSWGLLALIAVGLVEGLVSWVLKKKVHDIVVGTEGPSRELLAFSKVLSRLESEPVSSPCLVDLQRALGEKGDTASARIRRLGKLVAWIDQAKNQVFAIIAFFVMWRLHFALSIEAWREKNGRLIPRWLEASGELDALSALSGYAYENPADTFPEIVEDRTVLEGVSLGHPLIARGECVRNSVHLHEGCPLWVVSGSNMSGKSTFLRVIGVNAVLACAGAPVRADSLRISPLDVGSTIRVMDSLQAGRSRFYAEISLIKSIVDKAKGEGRLLFLLDEILHGTNSHDRRIGAESILKGLVDLGAVGLVTTHDLALAQAAEAMGERARNVHFDDTMEDGELSFDYELKPGVVKKSNALELMRSVGLDVGD